MRAAASPLPAGVTVPELILAAGETTGSLAFAASSTPSPGRYVVTPEGRTVGGRAEGMVVLPDDRIVVVGTARIPEGAGPGGTIYSTEICLVRYTRDGVPDPSFGDGGRVFTRIETVGAPTIPAQAHGRDVIRTRADALVVTGPAVPGDDTDQLVARYLPDGSLDPGFGTGGIVLTDFGTGRDNHGNAVAVLGLRGDGTLDRSFGIDGEFLFDWDAVHEGRAVSAADGSPMVAGRVDHQGLLLGLKENGFPVADWLLGGVNRTEIAGKEIRLEDLLETPSRPYGAGTLRTPRDPTAGPGPDDYEALVTGHHPEGLLDIAFSDTGFARVRYQLTLPSTGVGIGRQSDGTLILAGTANPEFGQFGVARLWP